MGSKAVALAATGVSVLGEVVVSLVALIVFAFYGDVPLWFHRRRQG